MERQLALAAQLDVPVCLSALVQLPMIAAAIGEGSGIGIVSTRSEESVRTDLEIAGIAVPRLLAILSIQDETGYRQAFETRDGVLVTQAVQDELEALVAQICEQIDPVGAILLDGSVLSPYAAGLRSRFRINIFDVMTAVRLMVSATHQSKYVGIY